jgi:hypothetical protein
MSDIYALKFYNVDNNRDPAQVNKELRALLDGGPAVLGLCETTGLSLPSVDGYRIVRDRSRPGRDNISAYVDLDLDLSDVKWFDLKQTWSNPNQPGQHWPRSILEFRAGRLRVWVAHAPPRYTDNETGSQREHVDKLVARMAPWTTDGWEGDKASAKQTARVCLWDANRKKGEGDHGPDSLDRRCDGATSGAKIDCGSWRGGDVKQGQDVSYPTTVDGVKLKSDHGHAFRFELALYDA